ncbi:energy-coupling factor transporter transmembrane component T family protein [Pseudothermotoga sp.]|nr:energy-coupling factor transporter transmembrane protein EcfT [Pseudothermotoga sp.]MDW8139124.1 energy-coupling factor transporter transmembrane protein EcfT [Pseudothermotoga sp.]
MNSFGKYVHKNSPVHRMNPALKIIYLITLLFSLFTFQSPLNYITTFMTLFTLILLSKIGAKLFVSDLVKVKWFLVTIFLLELIPFGARMDLSILFSRALSSVYIVAMSVLATSVIFRTTSNVMFARGFEVILRFFGMKKLARQISLLLTLSLIQIPILFNQLERIKIAQTVRGQRWNSKNLVQALRSLESILVPLFFFTLKRAESISISLEMRKYGVFSRPTLYKPLKLSWSDSFVVLMIAFLLLVRFSG